MRNPLYGKYNYKNFPSYFRCYLCGILIYAIRSRGTFFRLRGLVYRVSNCLNYRNKKNKVLAVALLIFSVGLAMVEYQDGKMNSFKNSGDSLEWR